MPTTLKVLKGNTGSFLTLGRNVSDATLKAEVTKAETDKWNGIELQSLSAAQGTIARVERQSAACEKIFAIHLYDKGLISKTHEELEQFHSIKDDSPIKNGKGPEQIYLKRRHADDWGQCKKKCKKFPPSLIIRKMQIGITMKAIPNLLEFLPANGRRGRSVVREV